MNIEELLLERIDMPSTYIGEAPMEVDDCQWIRTMDGRAQRYFGQDYMDYPSYAIYVRAKSNEVALARIKSIYRSIRTYASVAPGIIATRTPRFVGRDVKNRAVYVFRIMCMTGGY